MPVGTAGTVKAMLPQSVAETGAQIVLGNTFHLMLRPGAERVAALGGLHKFMNWPGPILTDSGGFQVMSLKELRKLDADGVTFRSPLDGSEHRLTPERSIEIQQLLDADITMSFDECTTWPVEKGEAAKSMRLSMTWAGRGKRAFSERPGYGLFGIVQGSVFPALRAESVKALAAIGFDGYAIGGLAVGEGQEMMFKTLDATVPLLPADRPRYLMGVGRPADIVGAVRRGIDMFDCVMPTRGALAAPGASGILPLVNRLIGRHDHVILTQDWHPSGHASFASSWADATPFSTVKFPYGPQILWPDHCVQGTPGAAFHPELEATKAQMIVRKGFHAGIDSYSAFRENDRMTRTGLDGYLKARGFTRLIFCGLALDYCVAWSAVDARQAGFDVAVVVEATAAIDLEGSRRRMLTEMRQGGINLNATA